MVVECPPRDLQPTQRPIYDIWVQICKHADVDTVKNIACVSKQDAETCLPLLWATVGIRGVRPGEGDFLLEDSTLGPIEHPIYHDAEEAWEDVRTYSAILTVMQEHIEVLSQQGRAEAVRTLQMSPPYPPNLEIWDRSVEEDLLAQWSEVMYSLAVVISRMVNLKELTFLQGSPWEPEFAAVVTRLLLPAMRPHAQTFKSIVFDIPLEQLPHRFLAQFSNLRLCYIVGDPAPVRERDTLSAVQKQLGRQKKLGLTPVTVFRGRSILDLGLIQGCQLRSFDMSAPLPGAEDRFFTKFLSYLVNSRDSLKRLRVSLPEDAD